MKEGLRNPRVEEKDLKYDQTVIKTKSSNFWDHLTARNAQIKLLSETLALTIGIVTAFSVIGGFFLVWTYFQRLQSAFGYFVPFPLIDVTAIALMTLLVAAFVFIATLLFLVLLAPTIMQGTFLRELVPVLPNFYFDPVKVWRRQRQQHTNHVARQLLSSWAQHSLMYAPSYFTIIVIFFAASNNKLGRTSIDPAWFFPVGIGLWLLLASLTTELAPRAWWSVTRTMAIGVWLNLFYIVGIVTAGNLASEIGNARPSVFAYSTDTNFAFGMGAFFLANALLGIRKLDWKFSLGTYVFLIFTIVSMAPGASVMGATALRLVGVGGGIPVDLFLRPAGTNQQGELVQGCLIINAGGQMVVHTLQRGKDSISVSADACVPHRYFWNPSEVEAANKRREADGKQKFSPLANLEVYARTDVFRVSVVSRLRNI